MEVDKLVAFLYILLRDHVTFGTVEWILTQIDNQRMQPDDAGRYSNSYVLSEENMARYAREISERILK